MDKLIEKFDMVVKIIDVDHVEGHKLKNVNVIIYEEQCANITKEVSCGFAHYLYVNYKLNPHKETTFYRPNEWFIGSNRPMNDGFTIGQVFNFYIKSL